MDKPTVYLLNKDTAEPTAHISNFDVRMVVAHNLLKTVLPGVDIFSTRPDEVREAYEAIERPHFTEISTSIIRSLSGMDSPSYTEFTDEVKLQILDRTDENGDIYTDVLQQ